MMRHRDRLAQRTETVEPGRQATVFGKMQCYDFLRQRIHGVEDPRPNAPWGLESEFGLQPETQVAGIIQRQLPECLCRYLCQHVFLRCLAFSVLTRGYRRQEAE